MSTQHYGYDAFISYSHVDTEVAVKIKNKLEEHAARGRQIRVFLDEETIKPGENMVDKMNKGLSNAHFYLLLLSPASIDAEWPTAERDAALLIDPSGRAGRVIPVIVEGCEIPPLLRIRKWIDLRSATDFDKNMNRIVSRITGEPLSHSAKTGGRVPKSGAAPPGMPCLDSHEPDAVDEVLYTNLYAVEKLPRVFTAPTPHSSRQDVRRALKCRIPPCVVSSNTLYTPSNMDNGENPLRQAVTAGDSSCVEPDFWFKDDDNKRLLTTLLNLQANRLCEELGLSYDKTGKKYYGDVNIVTDQYIHWIPNVPQGRRKLVLPYEKDGRTYFYRHRALKLSFHVLGRRAFLQVDPSWTFTSDGSAVIEDQKRRATLNTRVQSLIRNDAQFSEQRFWAWLLSKGGSIRMGEADNPVIIGPTPLKFASQVGVYGDYRPASFNSNDPPPLTRGARGEPAAGGGASA